MPSRKLSKRPMKFNTTRRSYTGGSQYAYEEPPVLPARPAPTSKPSPDRRSVTVLRKQQQPEPMLYERDDDELEVNAHHAAMLGEILRQTQEPEDE
jgi:hypothetical protein